MSCRGRRRSGWRRNSEPAGICVCVIELDAEILCYVTRWDAADLAPVQDGRWRRRKQISPFRMTIHHEPGQDPLHAWLFLAADGAADLLQVVIVAGRGGSGLGGDPGAHAIRGFIHGGERAVA